MKAAVTSHEIASALQQVVSTVLRRAEREGWPSEKRVGRGGGKVYPVAALPEPVRIALGKQSLQADEVGESAPALSGAPGAACLTELPPAKLGKAALKADLVRHYLDAKEQARRRGRPLADAVEAFVALYNTGVALPYVLASLGRTSVKSLERWAVELRRSGYDCATLADRYGLHRKGQSKVTQAERDILLKLLLNQNQVKIGTAIEWAKLFLRDQGVASPSSPSTLRTFVNQFRAEQADVWTLAREGEKALLDKIAPYFERDISLLNVGDVLIADGHVCNFTVVTGASAPTSTPNTRSSRASPSCNGPATAWRS